MSQQRLLLLMIPVVAILRVRWRGSRWRAVSWRSAYCRLYAERESAVAEAGLPPVQGFRLAQLFGEAGPVVLPLVFIAVWLVLLLHALACHLGPEM